VALVDRAQRVTASRVSALHGFYGRVSARLSGFRTMTARVLREALELVIRFVRRK
jgi:hypothetical protein